MMERLQVRLTEPTDEPYLMQWLNDKSILQWFPMNSEKEVEDSVKFWMSYVKISACLTVTYENIPCGMAMLAVQGYKKISHQCLLSIVVDKNFRGKGVGTFLLTELQKQAKERFGITVLHLEVYETNPAYNLYKKLGFEEYGTQPFFTKENGQYFSKVLMQKEL